MPVSKIQGSLRDRVSFYLLVLQLLSVVIDDLVDFLGESESVRLALVEPLLLTVVFKLEDGLRDQPGYKPLIWVFRNFSIKLYVDHHGQKQQILIETQLVFHVLNFREYLID